MILEDAKSVLGLDINNSESSYTTELNNIVQSLLDALPGYIEVQTGLTPEEQETEAMVYTVSKFILLQWYYADKADDVKLQRVIDSLLKCITLKANALHRANASV